MARELNSVEVDIQPERRALESYRLTEDDFYDALQASLSTLDGRPTQELPTPSNIRLVLGGRVHRLGDVARVTVSFGPGEGTLRL